MYIYFLIMQKRKTIGTLLLALSIFFIGSISCSKKIVPEKPVLTGTVNQLDSLPISDIDIPISIALRPLYDMAEKEVDSVYTSPGWPYDYVVDNCESRYMYRFRRSPLRISANNDLINMSFTGYYHVAGSQRLCTGTGSNQTPLTPWSPPCTCGIKEGERKVNVAFTAKIGLKNNYSIQYAINRLEPVPLDKCTVCFWSQDITQTIMVHLKAQLDDARKSMEDTIRLMNLRPQFQKLWDGLNTVFPLYNYGYLQINPEKIRISRFHMAKDTLYLTAGISARPVVSQVRPKNLQTLVPEISDFSERKGFNIYTDAYLQYDSLGRIINEQVKNKRIELEQFGKYIIIQNCEIYGAEKEKLILKIDFTGSESGSFYLTGKPEYNADKKTLQINNLDFDIQTRDLLVKTAKWMFNRKILQSLQPYTRFELGPYEQDLLNRINSQLNRDVYAGVKMYGKVDILTLKKIYPFKDMLVVRFNSSGNIGMQVSKLNF
jgi:hypothetical protein